MSAVSPEFMRSLAAEIRADYGDLASVEEEGPLGAIDYEVSFRPFRPGAASITWYTIADTFTISVSPRLEWQSEEWIKYDGDDEADRELGLEWSEALIRRIIKSGAQYVRVRSLAPRFLRNAFISVGDQSFDRPVDVLEYWSPWR